jgi:uncharacterized membrane protein
MEEKNRLENKETSRLEAFSDGVFAVAITLLVLNIKPPPDNILDDKQWWSALLGQLPALLAFVTSFFTIGIMWINHHRLFNLIKRTDTGLMLFNLLLLLVIVFIPYPTANARCCASVQWNKCDPGYLLQSALALCLVSQSAFRQRC